MTALPTPDELRVLLDEVDDGPWSVFLAGNERFGIIPMVVSADGTAILVAGSGSKEGKVVQLASLAPTLARAALKDGAE